VEGREGEGLSPLNENPDYGLGCHRQLTDIDVSSHDAAGSKHVDR